MGISNKYFVFHTTAVWFRSLVDPFRANFLEDVIPSTKALGPPGRGVCPQEMQCFFQ